MKKIEEHVADKYYRLTKKVKRVLETTNRHHRMVYDKAIGEHLMKDGQLNMELLDDDDKQKAIARHMSDNYISIAKQQFQVKPSKDKDGKEKKFDEVEEKMLARLVGGATYEHLYKQIKARGSEFTFDYFNENVRPKLMENLEENLKAVPVEHFEPGQISDIVSYVEKKQGKKIDFINKDALNLEDAVRLLNLYEAHGQIAEKPHQKTHYYLPKHKRKTAA